MQKKNDSKRMLGRLSELKPFIEPLRAAVTAVEQRYTAQKQALTDRLDELSKDEKTLEEAFVDAVLIGKTPDFSHLDEIPAGISRIEARLSYLKAQVGPTVDDFRERVDHFEALTRRVEAGIPGLDTLRDRILSLEKAASTIVQQTGPGSGTDPLFGRLQHEQESYAAQAMRVHQALDSMDFILKQAKRLDFVDIP